LAPSIQEQQAPKNPKRHIRQPGQSGYFWEDIEKLFIACGGALAEGRGSRIRANWAELWPLSTVRSRSGAPIQARSSPSDVFVFLKMRGQSHERVDL
jgi:hypothetical protein